MARPAKAALVAAGLKKLLEQIDAKADPTKWLTAPTVLVGFLVENVLRRPALVLELASYDARPEHASRRVLMTWNVHCCSAAKAEDSQDELLGLARDVTAAIAQADDLSDENGSWLANLDYDSVRYTPQLEIMNRGLVFGVATVTFETLSPWTQDAP